MVALFPGYNGPRPKSVGVVAGILALSLSVVGRIHAVGKTFHPLLSIAILFSNLLLVIL
jgi:hypothetical protein